MSASSGSSPVKAVLMALGANVGIAVCKFAAAFFTGSGAMLAEAIHSSVDSLNQVLCLIGLREAKKPATALNPLGYGRASYFWSFLVALLLFWGGGAVAVYHGIEQIRHPGELSHVLVDIVILGISVLLESLSLAGALSALKKERGSRSLLTWFRETRQAELLIVTGEDTAALAGLAIAFVAVLASAITGNPLYDAVGTILVGALLIVTALFVMIEVKSLLIGESAAPEVQQAIRDMLNAEPQIVEVLDLTTMQLGEKVIVSIKAQMRMDGVLAAEMVNHINIIEDKVKATFPQVSQTYFEPDVKRLAMAA
jgi:cation diffusion facilitator family transporter